MIIVEKNGKILFAIGGVSKTDTDADSYAMHIVDDPVANTNPKARLHYDADTDTVTWDVPKEG